MVFAIIFRWLWDICWHLLPPDEMFVSWSFVPSYIWVRIQFYVSPWTILQWERESFFQCFSRFSQPALLRRGRGLRALTKPRAWWPRILIRQRNCVMLSGPFWDWWAESRLTASSVAETPTPARRLPAGFSRVSFWLLLPRSYVPSSFKVWNTRLTKVPAIR